MASLVGAGEWVTSGDVHRAGVGGQGWNKVRRGVVTSITHVHQYQTPFLDQKYRSKETH